MKVALVILLCTIVLIFLFLLKLKKGKGGRIHGSEVEKMTFDEALVVDVRWQKEYDKTHAKNAIHVPLRALKDGSKVLDKYKDKHIILYCVVDITSRSAKKILEERGFDNLSIGDGIRQYNYGTNTHKNILMSEMKYLVTNKKPLLLNFGKESLDISEINVTLGTLNNMLELINKNQEILVYSDNPNVSLEAAIKISEKGYKVFNLIEPFKKDKYTFTTYLKKDYEVDSKKQNLIESNECNS